MSDYNTAHFAREERDTPTRTGSSFSDLAPEIQQQMYRRLGGMGLLYAGAWIANFIYFQTIQDPLGDTEDEIFWYVTTAICSALGLAVYFLCRNRRIPAGAFTNFAIVFEVLAGLGIISGAFGFEQDGAETMMKVGAALGFGSEDILSGMVRPLDQDGLRLLYLNGVTWVSVWLLIFPLVVPASMSRTVIATLLTASTVPVVLTASLLINGIPETMSTWVLPYAVEATIPTFICAGMAIYGSRVVYKLTRDLSKARQMGSYRLVEKIGVGGMGEVWKAKHRLLVRPAAVKLIRAEALGGGGAASHTALKRFEREAQATSGLSSPHSIELYDFGISGEGTFYYVMELLEGVDLKTLVEGYGPVPAERAIHILRQACHSLFDAHLTGIVHRDIKPANIFVCRYGADFDFVKVLDFGLVKQLGEMEPGAAQLTMEGITSGTPAFMAPEMVYDNRGVDARADIYAVGCVGYWLLTGELVFDDESPMAILMRHANDEPPPLSTRTELEIPEALEGLVLACLEKEPENRPQSARELSRRLAECSSSLPEWTEERAADWWRTHLPHLSGSHPKRGRGA